MPIELGAHSPRLNLARQLLKPKGRQEQDRFIFEGPTLLAEALDAGLVLEGVFATPESYARHAVLRRCPDKLVFLISDASLARLSALSEPSGIVAVAGRQFAQAADLVAQTGRLLLLAGLNDPGNVGTLLRSAEAFGLSGVLILAGTADPYQPKIVRSAMGSLFRLPIAVIAADSMVSITSDRPIIAAARGGTALPGFRFPERAIIAIGHERNGFGSDFPTPTATVEIPHEGPTESLNAAVAGSIMLYALSLQK